jgi:DNA-binding transcriptional regulator YbjK
MDARRQLIADAALEVIAADGIRGLTHLAVDRQAELSKGSTSYYCRKRIDLLRLALQRLYVLDLADLATIPERLGDGAHTPLELADAASYLIVDWLTGDARRRTLARFELYLAASHEPELGALLGEQFGGISQLAQQVGAGIEPAGTLRQAAASLMLAEGLMLTVVRQDLPTPPREEIAALLALLAA